MPPDDLISACCACMITAVFGLVQAGDGPLP